MEGLNQRGLLRDSATFWRDPQLGNLELLRATYVTHVFAPHAHEGYAIGVIEKGAQVSAFHRNNVLMPAGSVAAINPGEAHTGQSADERGWVYRMVYPDANNVRVVQAKERLSAGMSIVDVAQQTGFVDQSHLTRQFKRVVGITPGQYRRVRS